MGLDMYGFVLPYLQQIRIFDCDGLVTAQQESDESKDKQQKGWPVTPIVRPQFIPSQSATSQRNNGERLPEERQKLEAERGELEKVRTEVHTEQGETANQSSRRSL